MHLTGFTCSVQHGVTHSDANWCQQTQKHNPSAAGGACISLFWLLQRYNFTCEF